MTREKLIGIAAALVLVAAPLALGVLGWLRGDRAEVRADAAERSPARWRTTALSTLLYTLAFNVTFFVQELFLVLSKALVPGLRPTLFHNDHAWAGTDPVARACQGAGSLAILVTGIVCAVVVRRGGSLARRLFFFWMAYAGLMMALPQVVIGALSGASDVGMAMDYAALGALSKTALALVALAAIPAAALGLLGPLLGLAETGAELDTPRARSRFVFRIATLPGLLAIALIVPFRVPRELTEVVLLPVVVTALGLAWIQAGAWRVRGVSAKGSPPGSLGVPFAAVVVLFLVFHLVLRPGVAFYATR